MTLCSIDILEFRLLRLIYYHSKSLRLKRLLSTNVGICHNTPFDKRQEMSTNIGIFLNYTFGKQRDLSTNIVVYFSTKK